MPTFHAIAAMSENRVIGNQGKIPWYLRDDFRWFKHKTMGGTLVMGRKTFDSIGKPLPGRETLVLSQTSLPLGVAVCRDLFSLEEMLSTLPSPYWICGGSEIYRQLLSKCEQLYLTRVKQTVEGDAFFPDFEDKFHLEQIIRHTPEFQIERWVNEFKSSPPLDLEVWPFPVA